MVALSGLSSRHLGQGFQRLQIGAVIVVIVVGDAFKEVYTPLVDVHLKKYSLC